MLLVIDVGNTNIVAGVYDQENLLVHWRLSTDHSKTADEFGITLRSMFHFSKLRMHSIEAIIISSVVPPILVPLCHMCKRYFKLDPMVVSYKLNLGIHLEYDNPKEIGADRIVNAVSAYHKYQSLKRDLIIVDFGTATTFCALLASGAYLGGAIAPGIGISTEALVQRTAKLPRIELLRPEKTICADTITAMRAGVMYGFTGQMEYIIAQMRRELGGDPLVIATGGFANTMASGSKSINVVEPFLTLEGLRLLYEMNKN